MSRAHNPLNIEQEIKDNLIAEITKIDERFLFFDIDKEHRSSVIKGLLDRLSSHDSMVNILGSCRYLVALGARFSEADKKKIDLSKGVAGVDNSIKHGYILTLSAPIESAVKKIQEFYAKALKDKSNTMTDDEKIDTFKRWLIYTFMAALGEQKQQTPDQTLKNSCIKEFIYEVMALKEGTATDQYAKLESFLKTLKTDIDKITLLKNITKEDKGKFFKAGPSKWISFIDTTIAPEFKKILASFSHEPQPPKQ